MYKSITFFPEKRFSAIFSMLYFFWKDLQNNRYMQGEQYEVQKFAFFINYFIGNNSY